MRWEKARAGHYTLSGTDYAVMSEHAATADEHSADDFVTRQEWAVVKISTDENLDWLPTMREARARAEEYARATGAPALASYGDAGIRAATPDYDGNDPQTNVADALANIMLACDRDGLNFELALDTARRYNVSEIGGDR